MDPGNAAEADGFVEYLLSGDPSLDELTAGASQTHDPAVVMLLGLKEFRSGHYTVAITDMRAASQGLSSDDLRSLCLSYMGLSEGHLGNLQAFRYDILQAEKYDPTYSDVYASELSTGLYLPGSP
jgi:hypothetical protein